jgi:hypothetical protein
VLTGVPFGRPQYQLQLKTTAISPSTNEARVVLHKRVQRRRLSQSDSTFSCLLLLHHPPFGVANRKEFFTASLDADQIAVPQFVQDKNCDDQQPIQ